MRRIGLLHVIVCVLILSGCDESCADCDGEDLPVYGDQESGNPLASDGEGAGSYFPLPMEGEGEGSDTSDDEPTEIYVGLEGGGSSGNNTTVEERRRSIGNQACKDILSCMRDCLDSPTGSPQQCEPLCLGKGTTVAQDLYSSVQSCVEKSGCDNSDSACKASACSPQLNACVAHGAVRGGAGTRGGRTGGGNARGDNESGEGGEESSSDEGGGQGAGDRESSSGSCLGNCDGGAPEGCFCDDSCAEFGDCCSNVCQYCSYLLTCGGTGDPSETDGEGDISDFIEWSGSCEGFCGDAPADGNCYCDNLCENYGDCCEDRCDFCPDTGNCAP